MRRNSHGWVCVSYHFNQRTPCGGDSCREHFWRKRKDFNSRTPCGVRHDYKSVIKTPLKLQSTHPMRGATFERPAPCQGNRTSIHAPHAGCDMFLNQCITQISTSIHAPHAGCDVKYVHVQFFITTSIHAPMRGTTGHSLHLFVSGQHFNPRTPCGVRQKCFPCFPTHY